MSRVIVKTRSGEFPAELDGSDVSNAVWLSKTVSFTANMISGMLYGELPISAKVPEGERVTRLEKGDVAWWPGPHAICIFYGPTPLSGEDGDPVSPQPVIRIGKMVGDCSGLDAAGDRQTVRIVQDF